MAEGPVLSEVEGQLPAKGDQPKNRHFSRERFEGLEVEKPQVNLMIPGANVSSCELKRERRVSLVSPDFTPIRQSLGALVGQLLDPGGRQEKELGWRSYLSSGLLDKVQRPIFGITCADNDRHG